MTVGFISSLIENPEDKWPTEQFMQRAKPMENYHPSQSALIGADIVLARAHGLQQQRMTGGLHFGRMVVYA